MSVKSALVGNTYTNMANVYIQNFDSSTGPLWFISNSRFMGQSESQLAHL